MKNKTLILGIGSPFADDQFGWKVSDYLIEQGYAQNGVDIDSADRPGLNLLVWLDKDYDKIILVDAVNAKVEAGTYFHLQAIDIIEFPGMLSSHSIGVAPSLALAQALGKNITHVEFFGVQAQFLTHKDEVMSEAVKAEIIPTAQKIIALL